MSNKSIICQHQHHAAAAAVGSSSSSSSSPLSSGYFVEWLSKAFLTAALLMGVSVCCVQMMLSSARTSNTSTPTTSSATTINQSHEWALERFGYPSAFDDSLYDNFLNSHPLLRNAHQQQQNMCQPQRLHLAQATNVVDGEDHANMTLSFTLPFQFEECDAKAVQATVFYGRGVFPEGRSSVSDDDDSSEIIQFSYDASLAVPGLDNYQSDWIYHVTLPNLRAGRQIYWYRIVVTEKEPVVQDTHYFLRHRRIFLGESPVHTLMTPPVAHQATSLALVGDLGQTENSTKTLHHIYQATQQRKEGVKVPPVSGLVIAGDLSYSDGDPRRWESWLELMEPLLRSTPLYSIPGNHEIECDNTTHQVFGQYESYFRNPNRLGPADRQPIPDDYRRTLWSCLTSSAFLGHYNFGNAFWSVNHGLAKIIGLNSYTSPLPGSPQYMWLDHELQTNVDRAVTPWLIVTFHCPLHTTFRGHNGEINPAQMLASMEPLFVQYQVNLVVSGHDHAYLRTKPMQGDGSTTSGGPIYLTLGAGGNREQHSKGYINDIPEDWVVKRDIYEYGFGHLHLPNATHAHLTWVRDGTTTEGIQDSVWLSNQYFDQH